METNGCPLFKLLGLGRHWVVIKKEGEGYVEYDSLMEHPVLLSHGQLLTRLFELNSSNCTILKITPACPTEVLCHVAPKAS
jgi:hypothetical protein